MSRARAHLKMSAAKLLPFSVLLVACAAAGVDASSPVASTEARPAPRWAQAGEVTGWTPIDASPRPSEGHSDGAHRARVWVRPASAADRYAALVESTRFEPGTTLAVTLGRGSGGRPEWIYAMERGVSGWTFIAARGHDGARTAPGAEAACAGCHQHARADHVFGPPRGELPPPLPDAGALDDATSAEAGGT